MNRLNLGILVALLFPGSNYNLLFILTSLLLLFIFGLRKSKEIWVWLTLMASVILLAITQYTSINSIKYLVLVVLFFSIKGQKDKLLRSTFDLILVVSCFMLVVETSLYRDELRMLYRSSNGEFHYSRFSSIFLYPGDLGAVMSFISIPYLIDYKRGDIGFKELFVRLLVIIGVILMTQSRMAMFQIAMTILLFSLRNLGLLIALLSLVGILTYFSYDYLDYLFKVDPLSILKSLADSNTEFKRIIEIRGLFGLNDNMAPQDFYEGSIPGFVAKFGVLGFIVPIALIYRYISVIGFRYLYFFIPLIITSFVGAPFERPKLYIVSFLILVFILNDKYRIQRFTPATFVG